jgi:hypothetical protein
MNPKETTEKIITCNGLRYTGVIPTSKDVFKPPGRKFHS